MRLTLPTTPSRTCAACSTGRATDTTSRRVRATASSLRASSAARNFASACCPTTSCVPFGARQDAWDIRSGRSCACCLLTGQRRDEVAGARWREFDLKRKLWTVPPERFKSESTHLVPLTDDVIAILETLPRFNKGDHLFSTTMGEKPVSGFSKAKTNLDRRMLRTLKAMARERTRATLAPFVLHDLRRTVRTRLSSLQVPDTVAEMVIGHGRKGIQRVYDQHQYAEEMRDALALWARRLRDIVTPPPVNVVQVAQDEAVKMGELVYHDFERACRRAERGDNTLVLQYLFDDHPITEDDRLCLAAYFEGKFKLKRGQHKTPRIGESERAVREAAAVAKGHIRFLRKQGLSNRDAVREKGIKTALAYMDFEGIPVNEESLRTYMGRSKKKKRTKSSI